MKMPHLENLRKIYIEAVHSVLPQNLLTPDKGYNLKPIQENGESYINIHTHKINISKKRCNIVGFGKAILGMATVLERSLGKHLAKGILSIPKGTLKTFEGNPSMQLCNNTIFKVYEGAEHNQPDNVTVQAALDVQNMVQNLNEDDVLFVLISGGGSALLTLPREPLTLENKMQLIKRLASKGATIQEINTVRIVLSDIKGGKLALAARKCSAVISFILSDVIGDPLHLIASGPTYKSKFLISPKEILQKYDLWDCISTEMKNIVIADEKEYNSKVPYLPNNYVFITGNNILACKATQAGALSYYYLPFILSHSMEGNVEDLVDKYYKFIDIIKKINIKLTTKETLKNEISPFFDIKDWTCFLEVLKRYKTTKKPLLFIVSGEPTVKVLGNGLGGRSQELALRLSKKLFQDPNMKNVYILAAGTDGIDGPTSAAGALGCAQVVEEFLQNHTTEQLECYLTNNDSYNFYKTLRNDKYHIIMGHTGTNVMDLHFILLL